MLYIQRGSNNDYFITKYLTNENIQDSFTLVRTRDELNFLMGCLFTNSNKIIYVSEFKHSISENLYDLMNPDRRSKNRIFKHFRLKEFMILTHRTEYINLFKKIMPEVVDLTKKTHISNPIESKH